MNFIDENSDSQNSDKTTEVIKCDENKADLKIIDCNENNKEDVIHVDNTEHDLDKSCTNHALSVHIHDLSVNPFKRSLDVSYEESNKRIKLNPNISDLSVIDKSLSSFSIDSEFLSFESNINGKALDDSKVEYQSENNDSISESIDSNETNQLVPKNHINTCDTKFRNELMPKKGSKRVKWKESIVNSVNTEDSLSNQLLSETYYYYGIGIVTGEQGSQFGGNRFDGFSRHLLSDDSGITVELCKPFIINRIILELERKTNKKSPLFSYKVFIAIDECMTDWELIKDSSVDLCYGRQDLHFYPRIVQYIRIIGNKGIYSENTGVNDMRDARYFTLLDFDCIFDNSYDN